MRADASLLEAAKAERDRREETFPRKIAALRCQLGPGEETSPDIEALVIDFQCWTAIAAWLETDQFASFYGGTDPSADSAPVCSWREIEAAAADALAKRSARIDALEGAPNVQPETLGALRARRSCLFALHRRIQLRRLTIESINADFRAMREPAVEAA